MMKTIDVTQLMEEVRKNKKLPPDTVLRSLNLDPKGVIECVHVHKLLHVIQDSRSSWLGVCEKMRSNAQPFLTNPESLLSSPQWIKKIPFSKAADKDGVISQLGQSLLHENSGTLIEALRAIFEEFFMNATLSAPREMKRRGLEPIGPSHQIVLAQDEDHYLLACQDSFGALDKGRVFERMHQVYAQGAGAALNFDKEGGAGLGFVIVFENCSHLILGCDPGKLTTVATLVPRRGSNRVRSNHPKSLHCLS